jgi:glycosyltransferase involved in cell wall biosynthesis
MNIASFFLGYFPERGIGYCALSIISGMESKDVHGSIMATASDKSFSHPLYYDAIPSFFNPIIYRFFSEKQLNKFAEIRFISTLESKDYVYFWNQKPTYELYKKVHAKDTGIILEMLNTTEFYRKEVLDAEYARLGLPPTHGMTQEVIDKERKKFELTDFFYSCSPEVEKSLKIANVPDEKILRTSYGLRDSEVLSIEDINNRKNHHDFTVIFVGTIGVRKGPLLLLDYWSKANIKGKLKLVGNIDEEIKHLIEPYLQRSDVEHISYVNDLKDVYRQADLFALPSLEEGSPLVTYLALGAGLPSIVSPMGGGGVIDHDQDGLVIKPHDETGWIEGLKKLSQDHEYRQKLSLNAYQKAPQYLWSNVGRLRSEVLLARLKELR